ncbi:unnamed protein product [marine sediment metagenome]|uniref:Uncharacterized protein n=1 Tax=marine sediment metagenome TaxID=412755 RepID=X0X8E5_9ZZZZ
MATRNHRSLEQLGGEYSITATVMGWKHIFVKQKLEYIHYNPVRDHWNIVKNPSEYPYSSSRNYEGGTDWHQLEMMDMF